MLMIFIYLSLESILEAVQVKTSMNLNDDVSRHVLAYNGTSFVSYGPFTGISGSNGEKGENGSKGNTGIGNQG